MDADNPFTLLAEVLERLTAQVIRQDAETAELRDEVHALAKQVETLTHRTSAAE